MQDKQKVTLYLTPELHRKLKITAAVEAEPMSAIAERAIVFYLANPDAVDRVEMSHGQSHGSVHQLYSCPGCGSPSVIREGELVSLSGQSGILSDDELLMDRVPGTCSPLMQSSEVVGQQGEGKLVPC